MMKAAKLFIDGDWYSDIFYMFDSNLANIVKIELDDIGVTDCEDGDWFEWHVENLGGEILISGTGEVEYIQRVDLKVNNE